MFNQRTGSCRIRFGPIIQNGVTLRPFFRLPSSRLGFRCLEDITHHPVQFFSLPLELVVVPFLRVPVAAVAGSCCFCLSCSAVNVNDDVNAGADSAIAGGGMDTSWIPKMCRYGSVCRCTKRDGVHETRT
jgi:hypothetical protein